MLVLNADLYLVPFTVLKATDSTEYLCERYSLIVAPSLTSIKANKHRNKNVVEEPKTSTALVNGNLKIPTTVTEQWGWNDIQCAAKQAEIVAEILQTQAVLGDKAFKDLLMSLLNQAESIHFACHVSWKLSALVLSSSEFVESKSGGSSPK